MINQQIHELARLFQVNRLPAARALAIQLAKAAPRNTQVLSMLGAIHGRLGEFKEAESCYRTLVALEPQIFQHHCYLGLALVTQARLQEAFAPFKEMLRLRPDFAEGHMQMGCLLRDLGHHELAMGHLRQALQLAPALLDAAVFLCNILIFRGQMDEALKLCDQVLAKNPKHAEAQASKVLILEKQGHRDGAWQCLITAVADNVITPGIAIMYAKLAVKYDRAEHAKILLNNLLSQASWMPSQKQEMHFALGELNDKTKDYDMAFAHFHSANSLNPRAFDILAMRGKAERIINFFPSQDLPISNKTTQNLPTPIFIVGMPRSGTSLVEQILSSHPEVRAGGELEAMDEVERRACSRAGQTDNYPDCLRGASASEMEALTKLYLEAMLAVSKDARFVTDKLPTNYERLGLIEKLFPHARIIHTTRHPLDTCLSCYFQNFGNTHSYSSNLRALGEVYQIYQKLMVHWRKTLSIRILDVNYETLVRNPETTVRTLLEFCELPWDPRCLEFYKSKRYVNTASYDQVRQPIYHNSIERWKHYETHLSELIETLS